MKGLVPVALAAATLLAPAPAEGKLTCELDLPQAKRGTLHGLPDEPVAGRDYTVMITLPPPGANAGRARPILQVLRCPDVGGIEIDQFRGQPTRHPGAFALDLRFPGSGSWRVALWDRSGGVWDLGFRPVRPAPGTAPGRPLHKPSETPGASAKPSDLGAPHRGLAAPIWIGAAALVLGVLAGLRLLIRRPAL